MSSLYRLTALFAGTVLGVGLACALLTVTASAGPPPEPYTWHYQLVDSGNEDSTPGNTGLVRDAFGHLHLTYIANHRLFYGVLSNGLWLTQSVAPGQDVSVQTLAIDSTGRPHIAFVENIANTTEGYLYYAVLSGTTWLISPVDSTPVTVSLAGCQANLALDASDRAHIAYGRLPEVHYAVLSGTTWLSQTITTEAFGHMCTQLAVEPSGIPHVVFYDLDPSYAGALEYATQVTTTWSIQTVETGTQSFNDSDFGLPAGLALDSADRPHVAYYGGASHQLRYAVLSDSVWISTTLTTPQVNVHYRGALTLDALDQPHLAVQATSPYYVTLSGTQWIAQGLDGSAGGGSAFAIAMDDSDHAVLSYANTFVDQVFVAFSSQPSAFIFLPLVRR